MVCRLLLGSNPVPEPGWQSHSSAAILDTLLSTHNHDNTRVSMQQCIAGLSDNMYCFRYLIFSTNHKAPNWFTHCHTLSSDAQKKLQGVGAEFSCFFPNISVWILDLHNCSRYKTTHGSPSLDLGLFLELAFCRSIYNILYQGLLVGQCFWSYGRHTKNWAQFAAELFFPV